MNLNRGTRNLVLIPSLASALCASQAHAADANVEALLSKMRAAYSSVKSANYSTEAHIFGRDFNSKFTYAAPWSVSATISIMGMNDPKMVTTVKSDGKKIQIQSPQAPAAISEKFTPDLLDSNLVGNLESLCFFDWKRQLSTEKGMNMEHSALKILPSATWRGKKWTVLEETAASQKIVCSYYIDPQTNFIWRTVVKPMPGGKASDAADTWLTVLNGKALPKSSDSQVIHI